MSGSCPDIVFVLQGATVQADRSTKYKGGDCRKFEEDDVVTVSGTRESDGPVHADRIEIKKGKK